MGNSRKPRAGLEKTFLQIGELAPVYGCARQQHQVEPGGHQSLVFAKHFAQEPFGSIAGNSLAYRCRGGDHAHAGSNKGVS